jgi:polyhydroxyalkanoate synthesis regulator phasin
MSVANGKLAKKETVTTEKTVHGEKVTIVLDVIFPSGKVVQEAQRVYASEWREAAQTKDGKEGAILKDKLEDFLKENGIWSDAQERQKMDLYKEILSMEGQLAKGKMTVTKGRELSIQIIRKRNELRELLERRAAYDTNTAEALAENARFNYLVSCCVLRNTDGTRYFKDLDDYMERMGEPESFAAAAKFASMYYGNFDEDPDEKRPELKFLKRFNLINDKGQLLSGDKERKPVDFDGRPIDEENRYINAKGEHVTVDGEIIEEGSVEEAEFINDLEELPCERSEHEQGVSSHES